MKHRFNLMRLPVTVFYLITEFGKLIFSLIIYFYFQSEASVNWYEAVRDGNALFNVSECRCNGYQLSDWDKNYCFEWKGVEVARRDRIGFTMALSQLFQLCISIPFHHRCESSSAIRNNLICIRITRPSKCIFEATHIVFSLFFFFFTILNLNFIASYL